jgi:hypothetical protein
MKGVDSMSDKQPNGIPNGVEIDLPSLDDARAAGTARGTVAGSKPGATTGAGAGAGSRLGGTDSVYASIGGGPGTGLSGTIDGTPPTGSGLAGGVGNPGGVRAGSAPFGQMPTGGSPTAAATTSRNIAGNGPSGEPSENLLASHTATNQTGRGSIRYSDSQT